METPPPSSTVSTYTASDGTVLVIQLDDGKANALSAATIATVSQAIDDACAAGSVGAIVLAGRDGRFSGGFDLSVMQSGDFSDIVNLVTDGGELVAKLFGCSLPVVAACTGHAVAAGAMVLLGCDIRVGASGPFKIGYNEVAIGMVLPNWAMTISRERLTNRHIQRCVTNGRLLSPATAIEAGFLDFTVEQTSVLDRAVNEASMLAASINRPAYQKSVEQFRGPIIEQMNKQLAEDRAAVAI